jgi:hypothetical protein
VERDFERSGQAGACPITLKGGASTCEAAKRKV